MHAFLTKDQKAATVAKVFCEKYFIDYGLLKHVHFDLLRVFESHLVHKVVAQYMMEN